MIDSKKIYDYIKMQINPYGKPFEGTIFEFGTKIMDYIKNMDEHPKVDWIPCKIELPKTLGVYQVKRVVYEGYFKNYIVTCAYFDGQNTWHNDNRVNHGRPYLTDVIAWKTLEEP